MREETLARLDALIAEGEALPLAGASRVTGGNYLTGETHHHQYTVVKDSSFTQWRTSCTAVLDRIVSRDSILRESVERFPKLGNSTTNRDYAVAFLRAVRTEVDLGSLTDLAVRVEAEIQADFLDQAQRDLVGNAAKPEAVSAAVIAGASLERCLRRLATELTPPEPIVSAKGEQLMMMALIDSLKRRLAFNELMAKELRAWAALRNHAAHGQYDQFSVDQVKDMVRGVQRFLAERS
jgi:hypothetical protein